MQTQTRPVLACEDEGSGPPLLLVHGILSDARIWQSVTAALAPSHRTIRCDLRGHGRTPYRAPGSTREPSRDLLDLLDALGLEAVHLVGHAAGANTAAALALAVPERTLSLTVVDPVVNRPRAPAAVQEAWHLENMLRWLETGHGPEVRRPERVAALREIISQQTLAHFATPGDGSIPALGMVGGPPSGMSRLGCPLLVVVGDRTEPEGIAMVQSIFGAAPRFELTRIPGALRNLPSACPAEVAQRIRRFIARVEG